MSLHELVIATQYFIRFIVLDRFNCGFDAFSTLVFEFLYFISFIEVFSFNTNVSLDLLANRNSNWVFTTRFCQVNQFIEESIVVWSWFNLEGLFTVEDRMSFTWGFPDVRVPVLSKTMVSILGYLLRGGEFFFFDSLEENGHSSSENKLWVRRIKIFSSRR